MKKNLAIIPARGGSKRIPKKNRTKKTQIGQKIFPPKKTSKTRIGCLAFLHEGNDILEYVDGPTVFNRIMTGKTNGIRK